MVYTYMHEFMVSQHMGYNKKRPGLIEGPCNKHFSSPFKFLGGSPGPIQMNWSWDTAAL
jgi:hypothetical protein